MGDIFSLLAFIMSIAAVVLAGAAFLRVEGRFAEESRLKAQKNHELRRIVAQNADHRSSGRRASTFSDADLAKSQLGPELGPKPPANQGANQDVYSGYPSQKSIDIAMELDKKRQEARRVALESGLITADDKGDDGRTFAPSIPVRAQNKG